jgi:hypothetical protein
MAYVHFNHLNASAFNSFVPEATKVARNQTVQTILVVSGVVIGIWVIYKLIETQTAEKKQED